MTRAAHCRVSLCALVQFTCQEHCKRTCPSYLTYQGCTCIAHWQQLPRLRLLVPPHQLFSCFGNHIMQAARTFNIHHAADLQGPLQSPSRPVLYTHTLCPYAQRVFLTLLYKVHPKHERHMAGGLHCRGSIHCTNNNMTQTRPKTAVVEVNVPADASCPDSAVSCRLCRLSWCRLTCQTSPPGTALSTHAAWCLQSCIRRRPAQRAWTCAGVRQGT